MHFRWDNCPAALRSAHNGKEGFPTIAYEFTVNHNKKIMAVTKGLI